jgi:hypothetical protein
MRTQTYRNGKALEKSESTSIMEIADRRMYIFGEGDPNREKGAVDGERHVCDKIYAQRHRNCREIQNESECVHKEAKDGIRKSGFVPAEFHEQKSDDRDRTVS